MYKNRNKDFVKFTTRVDADDFEKFKKICNIQGNSANNQISILIRKFNFENSNLTQEKQINFEIK